MVLLTLATLLGIGLLAVGWLALRGYSARGHLESAAPLVSRLQAQAIAGETKAARQTLTTLQTETAAARRDTSDPIWRLAGAAPWLGDDVAAVATLAAAVDELAREALPPLVQTAAELDPAAFAPVHGRVDLAALARAAPRVRVADEEIRRIRSDVDALDTDRLVSPLRAAVHDLRAKLREAGGVTDSARKATTLLPPMLGAGGTRTYLLVFQNSAEARATGGLPGAYAVVRADRGRIRLVGQGTASGLGQFPSPVLPLTPEQENLYTDRLATLPADVNFTPDFPTAARLIREMYRKRTGDTVDAVVATDPVALSYLLAGSPPLRLPDGQTLRADNAVRLLLSDVYAKLPGQAAQDAFFAAAARTTFDALTGGRIGGEAAMTGFAKAVGEHRILVWSAHPDEQRILGDTPLGGTLPDRDGSSPVIGVFLNDGSGTKLGYYLRQSLQVLGGSCRPDGRREIRVRFTLGSTAPRTGLPDIVARGESLAPRGVARTNILFVSPVGGGIVSATSNGAPLGLGSGLEGDRMVGYVTLDVAPGSRRSVDVSVLTAEGSRQGGLSPRFRTTPTVSPWIVRNGVVRCDD